MLNIGITGQTGFVGTHLFNELSKCPSKYKLICFEDCYFKDDLQLQNFVRQCDVIVHLAAMMRSPVEGMVYETNMRLVNQVIEACNKEDVYPTVFFASSIQETNGSEYARCKLDGKAKFSEWAKEHHSGFGCMIFPNLFGPLARPHSHSFIATFCYQLTHNEVPQVLVDNVVKLKYIDTLLKEMLPFMEKVIKEKCIVQLEFKPDYVVSVSEVLSILYSLKKDYLDQGKLYPKQLSLKSNLFNTLISYNNI